MAEEKNSITTVVKSLMDGAEGVLTSKTVVGAPVRIGDQIIIPLSDVSIGCGAGSNGTDHKDKGAGGFSAKMTPRIRQRSPSSSTCFPMSSTRSRERRAI